MVRVDRACALSGGVVAPSLYLMDVLVKGQQGMPLDAFC